MDAPSMFSSLGELLTGSAELSNMPLSTLIIIVVITVAALTFAICKFDLIPGLREKIPFLCSKKEVCFGGETCYSAEEESDDNKLNTSL